VAVVGSLLAQTLPLALGAAISPIVLAITVAMLTGEGRGPRAIAFLAGAAIPLVALSALIMFFGSGVSLKVPASVQGPLDLAFAALLLFVGGRALVRQLRGAPAGSARSHDEHRGVAPSRAFAIGLGSMATNFTSLILFLPAMKAVAAAPVTPGARAIAAAVIVAIVLSTIWMPLLLITVAPRTVDALLADVAAFFEKNQRAVAIVLGLGFGAYLLIRGLGEL
jgi:hypothetical protein